MKISSREKRFLVAGVAVALVYGVIRLAGGSGSAAPTTGFDQLQMAQRTLRRDRELAAASQLPIQLKALESRVQQEQKRLLAGSDPNRGGAELQTWLSRRAADQQLEVLRTEFLPTSPVASRYLRVPVRIEMHGRITQIVAFLSAVLQGDQIASIDDMQVSTYSSAKDKELLCAVVVSGLMQAPGGGAK